MLTGICKGGGGSTRKGRKAAPLRDPFMSVSARSDMVRGLEVSFPLLQLNELDLDDAMVSLLGAGTR